MGAWAFEPLNGHRKSMPESATVSDKQFALVPGKGGALYVYLTGNIDVQSASLLIDKLPPLIEKHTPRRLTVDLDAVQHFDDFGALLLFHLKHLMSGLKGHFQLHAVPPHVAEVLTMVDFAGHKKCRFPQKNRPLNFLVRLGGAIIDDAANIRFSLSFLGDILISLVHICRHPRSLRWDDSIFHMENSGVAALPIVGLISFLLGLIMAFVSSLQLRQFGAGIYVAALVALAMVSELGPIITAIIFSGRSGSAFAAEIATMQISEEIDALHTMGFDPVRFLALPRVTASLVMVPVLTLFSDLFAIAGGLMVGTLMLDLTASAYISKTLATLTLFDTLWGMFKSVVFAFLISWVGCLRGFQARGGPSAVGRAATSSVVTSIFLIILFDSIFAVIRSTW